MIGSFCLVKNEGAWIKDHIEAWLPYLDEMVFFDGNSTDSTLQTLQDMEDNHPRKVHFFPNKDPQNLQDDYVRLFNDCLHELKTDYAFFLHPDMFPLSGAENLRKLQGPAHYVNIRSFAGNPGEQLYETEGRAKAWKTIMQLKPDLGLHYFGHYGAANEDMYFSKITGNQHDFYGENFGSYPYEVKDSGVTLAHFSDVRPYERRLERMKRCLINQGYDQYQADLFAPKHPRVNFQDDGDLKFKPVNDPRKELSHV